MRVRGMNQRIKQVLIGLAVALLYVTLAHSAILQNLRLGVTEKRTRLVYHFDSACSYEISFDDSSVSITFDSLSSTDQVAQQIARTNVGILGKIVQTTSGQRLSLKLLVTHPFYMRYFDLSQPDRLVVDLYAKQADLIVSTGAPEASNDSHQSEVASLKPTETERAQLDTGISEDQAAASDSVEKSEVAVTTGEKDASTAILETDNPSRIAGVKPQKSNTLWLIFLPLAFILVVIILRFIRRRSQGVVSTATVKPQVLERSDLKPDIEQALAKEAIAFEAAAVEEAVITEAASISEEPALTELKADAISPEAPVLNELNEIAPSAVEEAEVKKEVPALIGEKLVEPTAAEFESADELSLEIDRMVEGEEVSAKSSPRIQEEATPEFNFEEAIITWPVQVITADRPGKIMVVDDEEDIVKVLEGFLTQEKYSVLGLTDSHEALQKYPDWRPDLIITDVVMPKLSGVELIQQIQQQEQIDKVIFLSGRAERDSVGKVFQQELEDGRFEFFRKPLSLVQIGARIRDFFRNAREILQLRLQDGRVFAEQIKPLDPYQLLPLQRYLWDRIFEVSANYLGRRIESYFITDRMEPPANYMRRVGCQEREDYCIANICFGSNPICAADKIRSELEVMRRILVELRKEYIGRVSRNVGQENLRSPAKKNKKSSAKISPNPQQEAELSPPPARRILRRLAPDRKR